MDSSPVDSSAVVPSPVVPSAVVPSPVVPSPVVPCSEREESFARPCFPTSQKTLRFRQCFQSECYRLKRPC